MVTRPAAGYAVLPHTADLIVTAWAPTLTGCLDQAVRGLASTFVEVPGTVAVRPVPWSCPPDGEPDLLVEVLDEVIYLLEVADMVAVAADLSRTAPGGLSGTFRVVPVRAVTQVGPAPKAVTRHGLRLGERDGGWYCAVTVDV